MLSQHKGCVSQPSSTWGRGQPARGWSGVFIHADGIAHKLRQLTSFIDVYECFVQNIWHKQVSRTSTYPCQISIWKWFVQNTVLSCNKFLHHENPTCTDMRSGMMLENVQLFLAASLICYPQNARPFTWDKKIPDIYRSFEVYLLREGRTENHSKRQKIDSHSLLKASSIPSCCKTGFSSEWNSTLNLGMLTQESCIGTMFWVIWLILKGKQLVANGTQEGLQHWTDAKRHENDSQCRQAGHSKHDAWLDTTVLRPYASWEHKEWSQSQVRWVNQQQVCLVSSKAECPNHPACGGGGQPARGWSAT